MICPRLARLLAVVLLFSGQTRLAAQDPPTNFTREVSRTTSDKVTVDFELHPIRHANFEVLLVQADGAITPHTPPGPRTYLGTVRGHPGAIACGWLRPDGTLFARVAFEDGVEWSSTGGNAAVRGSTTWQPAWPTTVVPADGAGGTVYAAETGIDLTHRQLVASGGTPDLAVGMAEYAVMSANYIFLRDAAILHRIGRIMIRMADSNDPYETPASITTSTMLNEVKNQWNNVLPVGSDHKVALVARPSVNGGLAWVGVIGDSVNRYSANNSAANGDFSVVWRHEVGHNWASNHYEGGGQPEGPTLMSGNSLPRFSSSELAKIIAHRNTRLSFLDAIPGYPFPLPPRANQDRVVITPGQAVAIDVLANDSDSNGDSISILSFDATSGRGGTVTRLAGAGPNGRDLLEFTPDSEFQNGTGFFRYRIADATGLTATGYVMLRPAEETFTPLHHWTLDESSGSTAFNESSGPDGSHTNNPSVGQPGATAVTGRGVTYNGSNQSTIIPALGLAGNSYTFTAWIRRDGSQNNGAPILYSRNSNASNDSYTGLYLWSNQLRARWNGTLFTPSPSLSVPDSEWCLAAFSVSPTQVVVHLRTASGLTSSTHSATITAADFSNPFLIARTQPTSGSALHFKGSIDDVRLFPGVLSAAQIGALYSQAASPPDFAIINPEPGQAVNPRGTRFIAGSTQSSELLRSVEFHDVATTYRFGSVNAPPFILENETLDPGALLLGARAAYGDWGYRLEAAPVSCLVLESNRPVVTLTASGQPSFGGAGTHFVLRRDSTVGPLEVPFTLSGTAVRDADYTLPGNSVTFAAGQSEVAIDLMPAATPSSPGEKSVTLSLPQSAEFVIESPSSATVVFADAVRSIASGTWNLGTVWENGLPAPASGTQGSGPDHLVMGGHVVRSYDENGNSQAMVARALRVRTGGRLELARTHASTLQNVTYNIPRVSLDPGGTLRFVASVGSSGHNTAAPIEAVGNATIQFSGGAYDQFANLTGAISGSGNLTLQSLSNASATAANVRTLSILSAGNPYSGDWSIEHMPSGDDFGALRAAAVNALGSGGVTVKRRSRLINDHSGGLNSLTAITLSGEISSLLLNQPAQAPNAALALTSTTAEVVVGNAASTLGPLSGSAGTIRGSGSNSILALSQSQSGSFAGGIGRNLQLRKHGPARLTLAGPIDAGTAIELNDGPLSLGSSPRALAAYAQSGGTLELPGAAASPNTPRLTVTGTAAITGGRIEIAFASTPQLGVPYQILSYGTLDGVPEITLIHPGPQNLTASVQPGAGTDSVVTAVFEEKPVVFRTLTLLADPPDGGSLGGAGTFEEQTVAPITATPASGWSFLGWTGDGVADPAAASTTVRMVDDRVLTARFRYDTPPTVTVSASGFANSLGGETGTITLTRDSELGHTTVLLAAGGSAVPGIDYAPLPESIVIPHGETSVTLAATALPTATEGRQIVLTIAGGGFYQIGSPHGATVEIIRRIISVADGAWSQAATWNHGEAAPVTGPQGIGGAFHILDHIVSSNDPLSNSQALVGSAIRVESGGILDLARLHGFTIQNVAYDLPAVTAGQGATIRFRASVGSSAHAVAADLDFAGDTTLRINGGAYANRATLTGTLTGAGAIQVISDTNAGATAGDLRQITVASASNPHRGGWSVAHTPGGDDFAALRAAAANALGTGPVTVGRRSRLINAAASGLDSLAAILLTGEQARLELQHPWTNPAAALVLGDPQAVADLGPHAATIGDLSGTGGSIQGSGCSLAVHQAQNGILAAAILPGVRLIKAGPAALTLAGPVDPTTAIELDAGRLALAASNHTLGPLIQRGGTLALVRDEELPAAAPSLTVASLDQRAGHIEIAFTAEPPTGEWITLVAYTGTRTGEPEIVFTGHGAKPTIIDPGSGNDDEIRVIFGDSTPTLTVIASPEAGGEVTGGGTFELGSQPPLTATARPGWTFIGWEGEGISDPFAAATTVLMDAGKTVTARFRDDAPVTVTIQALADADITTGAPGRFQITRSGSSGHLPISFAISGNANPGSDFLLVPETPVIPDGESSLTVDVVPAATAADGAAVTLTLNADGPVVPVSPDQATVTLGLSSAGSAWIWDLAADPGIQGGDGAWSDTATHWTPDDGSTRIAWENIARSESIARFITGTGRVTADQGIQLAAIAITSPDQTAIGGRNLTYAFQGAGALDFGGRHGLIDTLAAGPISSQILNPLRGSRGLRVRASDAPETGNSGWLYLVGDNSGLTGGIVIDNGLVGVNAPQNLGGNAITLRGKSGLFGPVNRAAESGTTQVSGPTSLILSNPIILGGAENHLRVWGSRALILDGVISGPGGLWKTDGGTLTLTGNNRYSGDTTVAAGTLVLTTPFLADSSAVHLTSGATLDLPHGEPDTIARLWLGGVQQPAGIYDADRSSFITGSGSLVVTEGPGTPYDDWLAVAGLAPGDPGTGPLDSADGSGVANLIQFALGGNPTDPADGGVKIVLGAGDGVVGEPILLTLAVRQGAVFAGQPTPTATIDGIRYHLEGSHDLDGWTAAVEEVVPAFDGNGRVKPPVGYELRTFKLAPPTADAGYLRVRIVEVVEAP